MIAEISQPFQSGTLQDKIDYSLKKIENGKAEEIFNSIDTGLKDMYGTMTLLSTTNERVKLPYIEFVLSLPTSENITNDKFVEIAKEYMKRMGYEHTCYSVIKHNDTNNSHVHILANTIDFDSLHIPDGNNRERSYGICRALEKEFGLKELKENGFRKESLNESHQRAYHFDEALKKALRSHHMKGRILDMLNQSELFKSMNYSSKDSYINSEWEMILGSSLYENIGKVLTNGKFFNGLMKDELLSAMDTAYRKSSNTSQFRDNLQKEGYYMRLVSDKGASSYVYGIPGHNFYIKDKSLPLKYRFGKLRFDYKNTSPDEQKHIIYCQAFKSLQNANSYEEFKNNLLGNNVEIKERINKTGIYGLSFILTDVNDPVEFKASDISQKLTYKKLQTYFDSKNIVVDRSNIQNDASQTAHYRPTITNDLSYMVPLLAGLRASRMIGKSSKSEKEENKENEKEKDPRKKRKNKDNQKEF